MNPNDTRRMWLDVQQYPVWVRRAARTYLLEHADTEIATVSELADLIEAVGIDPGPFEKVASVMEDWQVGVEYLDEIVRRKYPNYDAVD